MDECQARVIILEDDEAHAELIGRAFRRMNGRFSLVFARSLAEARDRIAQNDLDLIISDMILPDGMGTDLLRETSAGLCPVVIMTSFGDEQRAVEAIKSGALDYVVKTEASLEDLPHTAERALREWREIVERKTAEEKLRGSLHEKELLLKEIHHRVKNNLQVIASLLALQSNRVENAQWHRLFDDSINRIRTMAQVHELLYQSSSVARIDFGEQLRRIAGELFSAYRDDFSGLQLDVETEPVELGIDQAMPCGLIANEILSNSFKYAFPPEQIGNGTVFVRLHAEDGGLVTFEVGDDGIGLPEDVEKQEGGGIGLSLIELLVKQIQGELSIERGEGTRYRIRFTKE